MINITIDPEFKALSPPLAPEELAQLEANILLDGCRDPLVVANIKPEAHKCYREDNVSAEQDSQCAVFFDDGQWLCNRCDYGIHNVTKDVLIDGHNRHAICERHGLEFSVKAIHFPDRAAAMLWIIDNQMGRRNLPILTRVQLQERRKHLVESRQGMRTDLDATSRENSRKVDTPSDRLAEQAGVSPKTYRAAKLILDAEEKGEITPEVAQAVRQNKIAVHRVAKDIKETRQKAAREEKRMEAVKEAEIPSNLIIGDFREHADKVPDGSLSLIFTDPPYDRKASQMLPALGEFAASKLMEGGSLVLYVGQTQIPAALDALRPHLRYWWSIACVHAGRSTVMREYGVNAGWKAVLWFVKGTRHDNSVMVNDVMSGGEEKSHHDWQQSESEAAYWIGKLTDTDGIVCDPFMGGGTTAAASKALGRKWIGFEIDENNGKIISDRLSK
jgi:hypothetical protein